MSKTENSSARPAGTEGDDDTAAGTDTEDVRAHLSDVADGCGCAEVWEHLSDGRDE
jgi:hypothetical protein